MQKRRVLLLSTLLSAVPATVGGAAIVTASVPALCAAFGAPGVGALDFDRDGLSSARECRAGLDPRDADSDRDGVPDGADPFPLEPRLAGDADCDGVDDRVDLLVRAAAACPPSAPRSDVATGAVYRVAFALVVSGSEAPDLEALARIEDARRAFARDFAVATGGRAAVDVSSPVSLLAFPADPARASLHDEAAALASARVRAEGDEQHFLFLYAQGVPIADEGCDCVAWLQRVRDPAGSFDLGPRYGSAATLLAVGSLGTTADLADLGGQRYRFLHEIGHAWCCRAVPAPLAEPGGAHWSESLGSAHPDPLGPRAWTETRTGRFEDAACAPEAADCRYPADARYEYAPLTLVAMGLLAPEEAPPTPFLVPRAGDALDPKGTDGAFAWVSGWDVAVSVAGLPRA